jgi:hypothetical protein
LPCSSIERWSSIVPVRCVAIGAAASIQLLIACTAKAQSLGPQPPGYREYVSILGTPLGSLPPLATYTIAGLVQHTPQLMARYGFISDMALPLAPDSGGHNAHSLDSFGLTGLLPVGLGGMVSLTVGASNEQCSGCAGTRFIGGIDGDYRILTTGVQNANANHFTLAVAAGIGVGHPTTGPTWTANLAFPMSFTYGRDAGTRLVPFIAPGWAFLTTNGVSTGEGMTSGRLYIGPGVLLLNPKSNFSASVGLQYIFVDKTQVQIGASISYGGR